MNATAGSTGTPRVAVVIPCFNDGATVVDTVESALQDPEPRQVVVVNDGSSDPTTLEVLAELEERGDLEVVHRTNGGLSAARMTGMAATTAPYVFALDADDQVVARALTRLADALDANEDAMLAWGDQENFGEVNLLQRRVERLDPWLLTYVNPLNACLLRRTAILEVGGWVLQHGYEDWDLYAGLAEKGLDGIRVPGPSNRYRISDQRMLAACRERHDELYAHLRERHPALFGARRGNRRSSEAPRLVKLLLPAVAHLPFVSSPVRQRLTRFAVDPRHGLRAWRARRT